MNLLTHNRHKHVVMFSGGGGSWATAKLVATKYGTRDLILLFADVLIEHHDLYRFIRDAAESVGGTFIRIADGRTPWQVFKDVRYLGNTRRDPCSKILKRDLLDRWLEDNCNPRATTVYVGIDASEEHRFTRLAPRKAEAGWTYKAPLIDAGVVSKKYILGMMSKAGLVPSDSYEQGFPHDNCGGGCVKAGQGQFILLYEKRPEVFAEWERNEKDWQDFTGLGNTILRDRSGGSVRPLPLGELRARIEAKEEAKLDRMEFGGCGCAIDDGDDSFDWPDDI